MNFHNDEYIMRRLEEHYEEAKRIMSEDRIVGLFLQGSQNYGLEGEKSDIDTRLIVVPSFEEICVLSQPRSYTHVMPNGEHLDVKDFRLYFNDVKKANVNFLELLTTKYKIMNSKYAKEYQPIFDNAELLAHYDPVRFCMAISGMARRERSVMTSPRSEAYKDEIANFQWAAKPLAIIFRLYCIIKRYTVEGVSFEDAIGSHMINEDLPAYDSQYRCIKDHGHELYTLGKAMELADNFDEEILKIMEEFSTRYSKKSSNKKFSDVIDCNDIMKQVGINLIKKAFKEVVNDGT